MSDAQKFFPGLGKAFKLDGKDMNIFISAEMTGTGAVQNIPHNLAQAPSAVLVVPTDLSPATVGQYTATEGAHDNVNVKVTVTTGKKYKVLAIG